MAASKPDPDPTVLTTEALLREVANLKELLVLSIKPIAEKVDRLQMEVDEIPDRIDEKVGSLENLHGERFKSIQTQFEERDKRADQTSRDSKTAVDAALQAAKEAVGEQNKSSSLAIAKSETATSKQIDQQGQLLETKTTALNSKIDDLKERVTASEGKGGGMNQAWVILLGAVGMILAVASFYVKH